MLNGRLNAEVSAETVSGGIRIDSRGEALRSLRIGSVSGNADARLGLSAGGEVHAETVSGDVRLVLPRAVSAQVDRIWPDIVIPEAGADHIAIRFFALLDEPDEVALRVVARALDQFAEDRLARLERLETCLTALRDAAQAGGELCVEQAVAATRTAIPEGNTCRPLPLRYPGHSSGPFFVTQAILRHPGEGRDPASSFSCSFAPLCKHSEEGVAMANSG